MSARRSSSLNSRLALAVCVAMSTGLGGCVDYLKRRDTVTLGAGEAQDWNKSVHIADPWPPYAADTHIPGDGQRTAVVIQRYSTRGNAASAGAASPQDGQAVPGATGQ